MAQANKSRESPEQALSEVLLHALGEPEIASYVASLKRRFHRYAMPLDEARKVVDSAMGGRTLTELLYEAREKAS